MPHYVAQVEYPPGAVTLLDALADRTGLQLDFDRLRASQDDAFARGAAESRLAGEAEIPSGDELADQFERYLARQRREGDG